MANSGRVKFSMKRNGSEKIDYADGGKFCGLLYAPKMEKYLTINEYGFVEKKEIFKGLYLKTAVSCWIGSKILSC